MHSAPRRLILLFALPLYTAALLALIFLFAPRADALAVEVCWDLPTTREDGSALQVSELASTTVLAGTTESASVLATVAAPATCATLDLPACNANMLTAFVTDGAGLKSALSDPLTVRLCRPSPPVLNVVRVPPTQS